MKKNDVEQAIIGSNGIVAVIAGKLDCTRKTVYNWLNKYDDLQVLLKDERENFKDIVENALISNILKGDTASIIFAAKTLCKDRGYQEKQVFELESLDLLKKIDTMSLEEIEGTLKQLTAKLGLK
jgi:hypothetical protein